MIKIIKSGFNFKELFGIRKYKSFVFIFYFIIMILFSSFPQNLAIIKNGGLEFNNIVIELNELANTNPKAIFEAMPKGEITKTAFIKEDTGSFEIKTKTFIIKFLDKDQTYDVQKNLVAFEYSQVVYYDGNGHKLVGDYNQLKDRINLSYLKAQATSGFDVNLTELAMTFSEGVKLMFSPYFIAQGIGMSLLGNIAMNTILLLLICLILLLVRINYKKVATYKEYLKIYIASFTLPVLIGVILGIVSYKYLGSFSQVIIQWGTPAMAVGAIFIGSKKERREEEVKNAEESKKKQKKKKDVNPENVL